MFSINEWDPLEAIIVGSVTHANWPATDPVFAEEGNKTTWTETPIPSGPVPQNIVDQAKVKTFDWEGAAQHKEAYLEKARKIVDDERMRECTFKPQRVATV